MIRVYFIFILLLMAVFMIIMLYYLGIKVERLLSAHSIKIGRRYTTLMQLIITVMLLLLNSFLAGMVLYMVMLFFLCDIVKAVLKLFENEGKVRRLAEKIYAKGMLVFWLSLAITIYGAYNAKNTVIKEYEIQINKEMEEDLTIIMISDVHAGNSSKKKQFDRMLEMVNKERADVICLCGDIFDESSDDAIISYAFDTFAKMESRYGIYFVKGNHDASIADKYDEKFRESGITVLNDRTVLVAERFYLTGRIDEIEGEREPLYKLLSEVDNQYPVIVLDHRPEKLAQVKDSSADLQLSGHTHDGQLMPGNLFVGLFNDLAYGHKSYKNVNVVVSSGFGTWGIPVRTGSHSEIVKVILQGNN